MQPLFIYILLKTLWSIYNLQLENASIFNQSASNRLIWIMCPKSGTHYPCGIEIPRIFRSMYWQSCGHCHTGTINCGHMIVIYDTPCQLPTNKDNGQSAGNKNSLLSPLHFFVHPWSFCLSVSWWNIYQTMTQWVMGCLLNYINQTCNTLVSVRYWSWLLYFILNRFMRTLK